MKHLLEETPIEAPQWPLTYGDLMSLLLTFFVMLLSMSEIKHSDKYQGMANSLNGRFGSTRSAREFVPGEGRPRDPRLAAPAVASRQRRTAALRSDPNASAATVLADGEADTEASFPESLRTKSMLDPAANSALDERRY